MRANSPALAPLADLGLPGLAVALGLLTLAACAEEPEAPAGHAPPLDQVEAPVGEEALAQSEWLQAHFEAPVAAQGEPPEQWTDYEKGLDPQSCGSCHPQQLADWQESWHHLAMGPGTMGQLVDWDGKNDRTVGQCNRCHANLVEQYPRVPAAEQDAEGKTVYVDNPVYDPELRDAGLTCAGCHVRAHERFGPPKPGEEPDTSAPGEDSGRAPLAERVGPHGGYVPRAEFQQASFCSSCHDFTKNQLALEGKLIQETGEEWRRTSYAAEGVTCQDCHMPEGRHTWKGIHDKDMVASGVEMSAEASVNDDFLAKVQASLTLTNTGVGHRFPTYTTPEVKLYLEQVDASGQPIEGTRREGSVARRITPNLKKELYDTRLLPGESYTLPYEVRRASGAVAVRASVEVWPDEAYRRFYEIKLKRPENHPEGLEQLRVAHQDSIDSRFLLWEEQVPLAR